MIKELDMNKYLVFKVEDVEKLSVAQLVNLREFTRRYNLQRELEGKKDNSHLVLNLDDEIDSDELHHNIESSRWDAAGRPGMPMKVKDIAVALVNAILKAKEENK